MVDYHWIAPEDREPYELKGELQYKEQFIGQVDAHSRSKRVLFQNLTLYAGNDKTYVVYVQDKCGNVIDLTNAVGVMTFRNTTKSGPVVIQKRTDVVGEGTIGAANKGEMFFYLIPADTNVLETEQQYPWDVQVQVSGKVYTVLEGIINLRQPVNL